MSCDEFYHRHFHKKVTHVHPHVKDEHHGHLHQTARGKEDAAHEHPEGAHLHEHTHEVLEHEHPVAHDLLHSDDHPIGLDRKKEAGIGNTESE
jgi:hypothetical protein